PQAADTYRELRRSIAKRGFRPEFPIIVWICDDAIWTLDGLHRRRAAREVMAVLLGDTAETEAVDDCKDAVDRQQCLPHWRVFVGTAAEAADLVALYNLDGRRDFASPDAKALAAISLYKLRVRDG